MGAFLIEEPSVVGLYIRTEEPLRCVKGLNFPAAGLRSALGDWTVLFSCSACLRCLWDEMSMCLVPSGHAGRQRSRCVLVGFVNEN